MERRQVRAKLSLAEFLYNGCFASANYLPVFLQSLGMAAGQIGLVTALTNIMNIVSQPVWGVVSDRMRSVRRGFILSLLLSGLCVVFVPALSRGGGAARLAMLGLVVLLYFFLTPANMMMELWLVRVNDNPALGISYGSVRIWASLGFALLNLAYVPVLKRLPVRSVYYFYAAFAVLASAVAASVPAQSEGDSRQRPRQRLRDMPFRSILTYWVVTYLAFEILFQIPFSWRNAYMVYALNAFGVESTRIGAFMFVSGMFEIPMLLCCRRAVKRWGLALPILAGALMLAGEYALYAAGRGVAALYAAQVLKGFGFALYVACRHQFISRLAPEGLEASTLAVINAAYAGTNIAAAVVGGFLLQRVGARGFFALLSAVQAGAGLFLLGAQAFGLRALGLRLPDPACRFDACRLRR